ncbi:MAG: helix-turn-helix domain-containing protein, partial [Terriglobales bacterium]
ERKSQLPKPEQMNLLDNHTRQALARQYHLSAREIDIVSECLQGKKNRQIALDLHIGISTVKRHLESAYRKMGISSSRSLPLSILQVARSLGEAPAEIEVSGPASLRSQAA